ncbi:PAS domain-containing protein [Sorangium sp. So ce1389]|uniref:PAS domain-containing protein n=1 Tax=Sorangium sp. So ce1389 TaxID=3133336 RepID=UPI003F61AEEC
MQSTTGKSSHAKRAHGGADIARNRTQPRRNDKTRSSTSARAGSEERQRFFALSLDLLCVAGTDGRFKDLNPRWEQVLGYSLDELMSRPFLDFVHPDDRAPTIAAVETLWKGEDVVCFTNRYRHKDGHYILLEWNSSAMPERQVLYALARDVTEREAISAARRAAEERLQHLLLSSRVVVYAANASNDFVPTFISNNVAGQFGYGIRELSTLGFWVERIHPEDRERFVTGRAALLEDGTHSCEYRLRHKDGNYRWIHDDSKVVRDAEGNAVEVVGSWQDMTERHESEQMIRRQAAALLELSTPLIPVSDDILVMPLIGVVDSRRAGQVLEMLLKGIVQRSARVAILDITGVGIVDTKVADTFMRIARAVQLVGTSFILSGIRPDVAQTLASLGADLKGLTTHSTLQAAIRQAMMRRGSGVADR